jgi:hypothetical protein
MNQIVNFGASLSLREFFGFLTGELKVPAFGELLGAKSSKASVEIEQARDEEDALEPEVRVGIEWLIANEEDAAKAVVAAIAGKHPEIASDVQAQIDLRSVHFHRAVNGDAPYVGFSFGCRWDEEHGLGVMMHGTRVVEVGGADTAMLEWIAQRDAEKAGPAAKTKGARAKVKPAAVAPKAKVAAAKVTSKPAAVKAASTPAAAKTTSKPAVEKTTSKPTAVKVTSRPAAAKVALSPAAVKVTSKPAAVKVTSKPVAVKVTSKPAAVKVTSKPVAVNAKGKPAAVKAKGKPAGVVAKAKPPR